MRRFSERQGLTSLSELNITPLLDLAFVLLIIFIITTPLMDKSVDLVIPSTQASSTSVDPSKVQTVSIDRLETIKLNMDVVTAQELETRLTVLRESAPDVAVVVRSHKDLPVQKLVDVMDVLQRAKIMKVGVVTHQGDEQ